MAWRAIAADDFQRNPGPIGANYTILRGSLVISTGGGLGRVHATSSGHNMAVWAASSDGFTDNQYSQISIDSPQGQHWVIARANPSSATWDGYACVWDNDTPDASIYRVVVGSPTQLAAVSTVAGFFSSGDTLAIQVTGPVTSGWAVTIKMFKNGTSVGVGYDNSSFNNYTTGSPGFGFNLTSVASDGYGDNWIGGNVVPYQWGPPTSSKTQTILRQFVST